LLFDYIFLAIMVLDWLILALLVFGRKTLVDLPADQKKTFLQNFTLKSLSSTVFLIFLLKIILIVFFAQTLNGKMVLFPLSLQIVIFVGWQLIFAFAFLFLALMLVFRESFSDSYQKAWSKKIFTGLFFLTVWDLIGEVTLYLLTLTRLMVAPLNSARLTVALTPVHGMYWLSGGLLLALILYFIFYFRIRQKVGLPAVRGFSIAYFLVLSIIILIFRICHPLIFPSIAHILNDFYLYLALIIWLSILLSGLGIYGLMMMFYRNRNRLKSRFYFQYLVYHLTSLHAYSLLGLTVITAIPIVFFIYY